MSNEQKIVSLPRELLEHITGDHGQATYVMAWKGIRGLLDEPAAQHQGEPVVLPARRQWNGLGNAADNLKACAWNACLDEIAKLGPLYTHADSGEVERLRGRITELEAHCKRLGQGDAERYWEGRWRETEARLAERDALLARVVNSGALSSSQHEELEVDCCAAVDVVHQIKRQAFHDHLKSCASLSTSAEPSAPASFIACHVDESCGQGAPVERDERAEFEAYCAKVGLPLDRLLSGEYLIPATRFVSQGWHARASLERKPAVPIEQHGTSSDKYKAELYDEVFELVAGLGYANVTTAVSTLRAERDQLQADLTARDERIDTLTGLLLRAWNHVNISDVALIVEIKAAIPGIASERGFTPTITIPPGAERYDGSDNGVD